MTSYANLNTTAEEGLLYVERRGNHNLQSAQEHYDKPPSVSIIGLG